VGIWHLIDLFERNGHCGQLHHQCRVTFEQRGGDRTVMDRGWELLAHNYRQLLWNLRMTKRR
jgi:hypothetical protein